METVDLTLAKAKPEDWESIYRNVWSRPEAARFMQWRVTESADKARDRMLKTIEYQKTHDTYLVYEKKSGEVIGFAGVEEIEPHIFQDASIALGPAYVGRGYGKQILRLLMEYCASKGGNTFYYSTRSENAASVALALSCGFIYRASEQKIDYRTGQPYVLKIFSREL